MVGRARPWRRRCIRPPAAYSSSAAGGVHPAISVPGVPMRCRRSMCCGTPTLPPPGPRRWTAASPSARPRQGRAAQRRHYGQHAPTWTCNRGGAGGPGPAYGGAAGTSGGAAASPGLRSGKLTANIFRAGHAKPRTAGAGAVTLTVHPAPPPCRPPRRRSAPRHLPRAGLPGDRGQPGPGHRVIRGVDLVMSRPVSAMISLASLRLTPGIFASRSAAAPGPGSADGTPSAETPQAAGMASGAASIWSRSRRPAGPEGDVVQVEAGQHPVVVSQEHALQCPPGGRCRGGSAASAARLLDALAGGGGPDHRRRRECRRGMLLRAGRQSLAWGLWFRAVPVSSVRCPALRGTMCG
jgi:hypothetical protein